MTIEFKLPELGENIEGGDVVSILVEEGENVSEGQSVIEIEAGKASMEIPSPADGVISKILVSQGDNVNVGQHVITIEGEIKTSNDTAEPKPEPKPEPEKVINNSDRPVVSAAPNVRRLARELGIDIHTVKTTNDNGRISLEDVKSYARAIMESGGGASHYQPVRPIGLQGNTRIEKMSSIRKATMNHMSYCWSNIPHVTQHDTADITRLNELRKRMIGTAEAAGIKLTITSMLVSIVTGALRRFPNFNASIDPEKGEIIYKEYYNIGISYVDKPNKDNIYFYKFIRTKLSFFEPCIKYFFLYN